MESITTLSDGTRIDASDTTMIDRRIENEKKKREQYEELLCDMDNPEYMARGNGFCDSKFSEDFIVGQIEKARTIENELEALKTKRKQ